MVTWLRSGDFNLQFIFFYQNFHFPLRFITFHFLFFILIFTIFSSTFFLVADTQLCKRLCPAVGPSIGPSVHWSQLSWKCKNAQLWYSSCDCLNVCMCESVWEVGLVWMRVVRPCSPVRNDIVTSRHLFLVADTGLYTLSCWSVGPSHL